MKETQRADDAGEIPPETPSAAVREAGSDAEARHLTAALGDTQTTGKEQIAHVPHSRQHAPDK